MASTIKLKFFLNLLIFIAVFALISSSSTLYFENKIDKIDTKIILQETNEIIFNNQIENIPSTVDFLKNIIDDELTNQINFELIDFLQENQKLNVFYDEREKFFQPFYAFKNTANIIFDNSNQIITDALLISEDTSDLKIVNNLKMLIEDMKNNFIDLDNRHRKIETDYEIYYRDNFENNEDDAAEFKTIYYEKYQKLKNEIIEILNEQIIFLNNINNQYFIYKKNKSNTNILDLQKQIELYSRYESNLILFAFIIQIILFLCIQYFEFSVNTKEEDEKK